MLITWHLYQSHRDIDPGELTDLRSASVNNENFAQVAVRNNLYKHLQHSSTLLLSQITEYVKSFPELSDTISSGPTTKAPKVISSIDLQYYYNSIYLSYRTSPILCNYMAILMLSHKTATSLLVRRLNSVLSESKYFFLRSFDL